MTFKHKIKFIMAVFRGDVTKAFETTITKINIDKDKFNETMKLDEYIPERKRFLLKVSEGLEGEEGLEEIDQEYEYLEKIEGLIKTWQKTKT